MAKFKPVEVRQLELLLQDKLIPWAQNDAPMILFDAPPRSSAPLDIQEYSRKLPQMRSTQRYPYVTHWRPQGLNAISVTVLGCIFEGEAIYHVHAPVEFDGEKNGDDEREWIVTVPREMFFAIAPGVPFSDGTQVPWKPLSTSAPAPVLDFARGILLYLRRDGVGCRSFTFDKGKLWTHPYIFLHQLEAGLLGEKLLREMRALSGVAQPVASLYWQLILRLLLRSISRQEYSELETPLHSPQLIEYQYPPQRFALERIIQSTAAYIEARLSDPLLSSKAVAQHIGLSERHLNRLLQEEIQLSIFQCIQQQRSAKACELLAHSGITISEVAIYCGFSRLSAFSAWFSKYHQLTPSEYRYRQKL